MTRSEYAMFKRAMEWYSVDPSFRQAVIEKPTGALGQFGFAKESEQVLQGIRLILRGEMLSEKAQNNQYIGEFLHRNTFLSGRVAGRYRRDQYAADEIWRYSNTVRNRCRMESCLLRLHANVYFSPVCFELSDGCSVQCPFCGFAAKPWTSDFRYTEENRKLWRAVVQISRELLGAVVDYAPCYFATEPLDNPDYEMFLLDMRGISGHAPQTTTALAEKYPERIRSIMRSLGEEELAGNASLRISIRSIAQFRQIMKLYSAEELEHVELLPNNPESVYIYSASGKAAKGQTTQPERKRARYSISCCAGILVNMVQKTMAFVEPELPDAEHPLGISTKKSISFQDAGSYREGLISLFRAYAFGRLPYLVPVRFNRHIRIEENAQGIRLCGDETWYQVERTPVIENTFEQLVGGVRVEDLIQNNCLGDEAAKRLYGILNELYIRGYIRLK